MPEADKRPAAGGIPIDLKEEGAKRVIQAIEQNKNFVQYRGVQIARKGC